jgi:sec-independent protein translocase protein TatC
MAEEPVGLTFWDHVAEFVKRMKIVLATFLVSLFVMLILPGNSDFLAVTSSYEPLMSVIVKRIAAMTMPKNFQLIATSMSDPITLYVFAALVFAVAITLPVFAYEAYKFVDPALFQHERKMVFPFVSAVAVLFIAGGAFGFFFLVPAFIQGFVPFFNAVNAMQIFPIMDFYNTIFFTILLGGFLFTIPAFFVLLVKFNILNTKMFAKKRKWIYLALIGAAMLVSPGATPLGDLYLFIALAMMFEVSMLAAKRYEHGSGTANVPAVLKFFSKTQTCKFCHTEADANLKFCPTCNRVLS